ncbi:beta-propeller domain-containing protein [Paenibacillus cremeus]|uniref:Copper amine oxidase-like N-terminal domain-containing protein n=1 Tax=Paenibacillus cremeus TaxID=2163881 RepID=A0A559K3F3_9BACL|nr:beta-propeller domain-containing protein [Paenibacillus cremeus]TVY06664.1 hypothetical protein FPZ49_27840 [Paenibacillus cremeus]
MRKTPFLGGILALSLLASTAPGATSLAVAQAAPIALILNGSPVTFTVAPQLVGSTMMVPLRDLSEALGVTVDWDETDQTASASKGERSIQLTVGSKEAKRNGQSVVIGEGPQIANGKLLVPLRFFSETFDFNVYWDGLNLSVSIVDADKSLPTVGSLDRLQELLKDSAVASSATGVGSGAMLGVTSMVRSEAAVASDAKSAAPAAGAAAPSASAKAPTAAPASPVADAAPGYSSTNVQVQGVDEADVIKTDGQYIYQVNRNRVLVSKAYPAESMTVVSSVYWSDPNFNPREIYVDNQHLVVVGSTFYPAPVPAGSQPQQNQGSGGAAVPMPAVDQPSVQAFPADSINSISSKKLLIYPGYRGGRSMTKTLVYELGDRTNLKQVREAELEGNYLSSRKVGDSLYVVTNKYMNYYGLLRTDATPAEKQDAAATPVYRDSAAGDSLVSIGYEDIRYFPKAIEPNYLLVGGMNLSRSDQKMQVTSYLGSGQNVYASQSNLYIAVNEYEKAAATTDPVPMPATSPGTPAVMPVPIIPRPVDSSTAIYKFAMNDGSVRYTGRGKVPGHPLNQYSMDEQDGYFRIATTSGETWRNDEFTSKNNVYVLNEAMSVTGKIEDIAPGERIYSVRYAGNRAYMVTFKQVDPLFVIDLKDPTAPKIVGKLKIPGYSDYLQPYDENHIIGFGKDAVVLPNKNAPAGTDTGIAYYQGMKLAMFDVTDVENPKEMFKESIGDRGTDSELLHNPKALLFSKEKNLLAFPITVTEVKDKSNPTAYGEFAFQGAYVYQLDLEKGFQLRGKITHYTAEDLQKSGYKGYVYGKNIERLLYIGDTLYSSSQSQLKANDLKDLHEIGSLTLPAPTPKKPKP